jgi:hypothetical protein
MGKMNIVISKEYGIQKAKTEMKERVAEVIIAALRAEFGEEAADKVRIVPESDPTKGTNEIGCVCADIAEDGGIFDGCVSIKITGKDWTDRVGTKAVKSAWSFEDAKQDYDDWVKSTAEKKAATLEQKKAKMKADAEARAKRKAEAEAKKKAKEE